MLVNTNGKRMLLALSVTLLLGSALLAEEKQRQPIPTAEAMKGAEKTVKEVYKEDFSKKAMTDRLVLADKLAQVANDANNEPATLYYALKEAVSIYIQGVDYDKACRVIDSIGRSFEVDGGVLKAETLTKAASATTTPEARSALLAQMLSVMDELVAADNYDPANKLATTADGLSRSTRNESLMALTATKVKEIKDAQPLFTAMKAAEQTLKNKPDDPAACLLVGKFRCFVKGDWEVGLPLLAKGSDAALKALAEKDLANPTDAKAKGQVADAWWEYGDRQSGSAKSRAKERAVGIYRDVVNGLGGLEKTKIEQRIKAAEIAASRVTKATPSMGKFHFAVCKEAVIYLNGARIGDTTERIPGISKEVVLKEGDVVVADLTHSGVSCFRMAFVSSDKKWFLSLKRPDYQDVSQASDIKRINADTVNAATETAAKPLDFYEAKVSWEHFELPRDISEWVWGKTAKCKLAFVVKESLFKPR